ncbi:hypothetical protein B5M09_012678 [Aphanomyces astaci]|uniref:CCHC-type domain-containing protein n=1 Tax=Aphanomyces astaci TaxID=112090 RepID=A0A425CBL8_APHAT|nr:hypothetical protein B5M09_012678 [Aphanomyces astaci]
MKEQCKKLRVGLFGDVASRDVSYMERVNNIIDTTGWKSQHKAPNMLKTFIEVVASCITPFDPRKRAKYGPGQDNRGALYFVCQQPGHRACECPNKKEDSARADHLRKGKNAVKRFKYKQRKAELKAKRAKIAEDDRE